MTESIPAGAFKPPPWWVANSKPGATDIEWPPVVGEARYYAQALETLQQRLLDLKVTHDTLDAWLLLPMRYSSKCFMKPPLKRFSTENLLAAFVITGVPLLAVEDAKLTAMAKDHCDYIVRQVAPRSNMLRALASKNIAIDYLRKMGVQGGIAAAKSLTPEQRKRRARKAANALWAGRAAGTLPKAKPRAAIRRRRRRNSAPGAVRSRAAPRCALMPG